MTRDIDDLVDDRTRNIQSVGEEYHDEFLISRPKTEWPPYIDETAKDLTSGIQISDLNLSRDNFGREVGSYYRRGLKQTTGRHADLPSVLEQHVSDQKLGLLAYQLNELSYEITHTDTGITNVQDATEAVIEKLLTRHVGQELSFSFNLNGGTVADIAAQLFKNDVIASNVDVLLEEFEKSASQGLLSLMDEPQMMTPLWDHQREALSAWYEQGRRGYVDMATATGKTVLGLATLALQYGELHPVDQDLIDSNNQRTPSEKDDILIVAHSDLILEQWRREFDRHLNIPKERTSGDDDIMLSWGQIHFRTPQALVNDGQIAYDLILLDEAHHYATGSEWGTLLDELDGDILAMSGSVDDAGSNSKRIKERLTNSIGTEVKRYTITDAKSDGIIPSFDWEVHYAPYDTPNEELEKTARRCEQAFNTFQQRRSDGELEFSSDRRLRTYDDLRRFSHTTEGNELKQRDDQFRDLVTRLFSHRTKRWNLSPTLDSIVNLVIEHSTTENVIVLADSNAQVEELESRLNDIVADQSSIYLVSQSQSRTEQRETIGRFDEPESTGILLGTGDLIGEGVDMQHASVAINMATGGVNPELVQRIGRVLRNPDDTPKHAMFYNVIGVPPSIEAAVPREDGKQLIEEAAEFCSLGRRFDKLPGFAAASTLNTNILGELLRTGADFINTLNADNQYGWETDTVQNSDLTALHSAVLAKDGDAEAILGAWEEYSWGHSEDESDSLPPETVLKSSDDGQDRDDKKTTVPDVRRSSQETGSSEDQDGRFSEVTHEHSEQKQQHIADIVRLQPTKNAELQSQWGLSSGREVHRYLKSELSDYYFRDNENLIWATDAAIETQETQSRAEQTADTSSRNEDRQEPNSESPQQEITETKDQTVFWNRDVEKITEYGGDATDSVDPNLETSSKRDSLDKKIDEWKSQLLDLSQRNKLIAFKPTKTKSLPFEDADPIDVADVLVEDEELYIRKHPDSEEENDEAERPALAQNELLPIRTPDETNESLYQIALTHKQYLRERGVDTLYLSLGMLRWYSVAHSDSTLRSPLFLAPVKLEAETLQDKDQHNYVLKPKNEGLRLNPALRKKLAAEHDLQLPADSALSLEQVDAAFESVYEAIQGFERWTIQQDVVLGIFDFAKFSIYSDLERNRTEIKNNPIIQALNGNISPLQQAEGDIETPTADELDDLDPIETYQVLDADSSQQEAIEAAKRGKSFVLQGPPGTGKSQTIANIIAEKLADGETVLFVSEKQAALDVVKNRLDDVGIGRFCLEAHGRKANKTDVLSSLEDELQASQVKPAEERKQQLQKLRERRDTINEYGNHLCYSPPDWDLTAYQTFGIVSKHMSAPRIEIGINHPLEQTQETVETAIDELETLARFDGEINTYDTSPWRHTTLTEWRVDTGERVQQSLERQLVVLDEIVDLSNELESKLGIRPRSLAEFRETSNILQLLCDRPDLIWQEVFFEDSFAHGRSQLDDLAELEQERRDLIKELSENYQRSFFSTDGSELNNELAGYGFLKYFKSSYRSLKRQILNHAQTDYDPGYAQLLEDTRKLAEVQRIEDLRDDYQNIIQQLGPLYQGGDTDWETLLQAQSWAAELKTHDAALVDPITEALLEQRLPEIESLSTRVDDLLRRYDDAAAPFEKMMAIEEMSIGGRQFRDAVFTDLKSELEYLHERVPDLKRRVQFSSQLSDVRETICHEYVDHFFNGDYAADQLVPGFKKRFYTKWLNEVYSQTDLGSFTVDKMERYLEEFRQLDKEQQELAKIEIQHKVTQRRPSLSLQHASSSEQMLVRRETEKQRRHKPLRELFDEAGSFITKLKPCFMMSPLSVAQYLKANSIDYDTVIFDEASQIMPQDAISSLIRADQAIIAGDTKQLPPTSFFQSDVETTEDVREDLDSILEETASVLPEKHLRWHYRSRTKELIEFSNYHYYNNRLKTFPENDPDVETGISFEYVSDGIYDRGGSRQNEIEAQRVVDLIEDHAENHSDKSLGVVAFSSAQEQAIRDVLEQRCEENGILNAFVSQDDVLNEFFIKNLEMVQGDERDRMIFSVGYGPDENGTVSMNFGPLNKTGGERRLNVAVTRAKEKITLVSSLQPGDIDLTRTNSTGVKDFKNYLEYAKKGKQALVRNDTVTTTRNLESPFEEAVYSALEDHGFDVVSQVESSSYSIDLAIKHPERPGKFVLGIECDGAAYHSSKTARDRDRTRQAVLEDLGWTIHRIWSPDWASNRDREIEKIKEKVNSLVAGESVSSDTKNIPSYEPEVMEAGSKTDHEEISEYQQPSLNYSDRYSPKKQGPTQAVRNSLEDVVVQFGPIKRETAFQAALDVWSESRLGKNVRQTFETRTKELKRAGKVVEKEGILWPQPERFDFTVRINTDSDSRSIDEIPIEEVAKATSLLLEEGGQMTQDDLGLEASRLFGYQRRGKRIQNRVENAIQLLESIGAIQEDGEKIAIRPNVNIDDELLQRVYS